MCARANIRENVGDDRAVGVWQWRRFLFRWKIIPYMEVSLGKSLVMPLNLQGVECVVEQAIVNVFAFVLPHGPHTMHYDTY